MGNQLKDRMQCLICGDLISTRNCVLSRHVKKHGMSYIEYIKDNYICVYGDISACGFCDNDAVPEYVINHESKEYSINYSKGYMCGTDGCKNSISLDIIGTTYSPDTFEKIGSRKEYLSKLYKIDESEAMLMKYDSSRIEFFDNSINSFVVKYGEIEGKLRYDKRIEGIICNHAGQKFPCTLDNFIERYGEIEGKLRYDKRCEKISYTSSKGYLIDKYGKVKADELWKRKYKTVRVSKSSKIVGEILTHLNIEYETEKNIFGKFVDYYLPDYNMVIEFYGDYWHSNPKIYESDYYVKQISMTSKEIWIKDSERLGIIKNGVDSIIVIWESSKINESLLLKVINEIFNKKTIMYI
jgi:G:T-mismatch repair DNA endonuclease (very short patch repair protein)